MRSQEALSIRGLLGLVCGLDASILASLVTTAVCCLRGLDIEEPLRLGIAAATGAAWAWLACR